VSNLVRTKKLPYVVKLARGDYYWCACGLSKRQPYCDGSHRGTLHSPMKVAQAEAGEVKPAEGLRRMLAAGVDPGHITFTSDGQGSLPEFDALGRIVGLGVGRVTSLFAEVRDAVLDGPARRGRH